MTPGIRNPPLPPLAAATACDLHPAETVTGFCASCLRERLAGLDASSSPSAAAAAASPGAPRPTYGLRSFFSRVSGAVGVGGYRGHLRPELRRCKSSVSGPRASASVGTFEPQRRSCDVRRQSTLWSLFHQDDRERVRGGAAHVPFPPSSAVADALLAREIETDHLNLGFPPPDVPEITREEEEEDAGREIRALDPDLVARATAAAEEKEMAELKPIKTHIDLESQSKMPPPRVLREIAGSFWTAASVFSKKLQEWRKKQKLKKQGSKAAAATIASEKALKRSWLQHRRCFRNTQSEVAADAYGRRSCDTDPRFSMDAGRVSFDQPRYSFDGPRAFWDGHLGGGRSVLSHLPPMLSVIEDVPSLAIQRSDSLIPVEEDTGIPGGSAQTRDYYLDSSSSRKRRSFEQPNSIHKIVVDVPPDSKLMANGNAKVSPAGSTEFYHCRHSGSNLDRELRGLRLNSLKDDISESFESSFHDSRKATTPAKKPRRWVKTWNIWGFIHKRGSSRGEPNLVGRPFPDLWPEALSSGYGAKMHRSNGIVSARSSFSGIGGLGSMMRSSVEINGHGMNRRVELVLERNGSCRYSPSRVRSTPTQSSRPISSQPYTRSMI